MVVVLEAAEAAAAAEVAAAMGEPDAVVKVAALGEGLLPVAVDGLLPEAAAAAAASCCWGLISFPGELMVDYCFLAAPSNEVNKTSWVVF